MQADYSLRISAKTGQGLEEFRAVLEKILLEQQIYVERLYPYSEAGKIALIRRRGRLVSEEYLAEGIQVKAYVPKENLRENLTLQLKFPGIPVEVFFD